MPIANSKSKVIRLASNEQTWREIDQVIEDCVAQICRDCDCETVHDFMFLVDVLTNPDIDRTDREVAAHRVQTLAFTCSPKFEETMEAYLNEINPGRILRKRRRQLAS